MSTARGPHPESAHFQFLRAELELCLTFGNVAETSLRIGHTKSAQSALEKAERGYETVNRFLKDPKHRSQITGIETQQIAIGMHRLREKLDALQRDSAI